MQPTKKKPNKQPVNAFFFYALDFRAKQAKKGIIFDNITQATNAASPSWQKLSPQERVFYEVQSKQNKLNKQSNGSPNVTKYTSQGVSYDEIDRMKLDKENAEKAMRNVIKEILQVAQENGCKF